MPWITRGLRDGIVTTRYPRRPDGYGDGFRAAVRVLRSGTTDPAAGTRGAAGALARLCPTGAIVEDTDGVHLDRGRCIVCGACVAARPDRFAFVSEVETAALSRHMLVAPESDDEALARLRADLADRTRALRRSIHIRHVDAGSDGAEEWEVAALTNPVYDVARLGIFFTASPRHADLLLVTGVATAGMAEPLRRTYEAMPDPKIVLAAGTDSVSGGLVHPTYATRGSVAGVLPVDVWVPGSPPSPFSLLHGILLAMGLLPERSDRLDTRVVGQPAQDDPLTGRDRQ
ncbi:MAG: NADH:ubiquinone oxidoreductase [Actinomycetota bacterium]|nr:NADH:ubiquinone oxidoreductase [Actinomycetota bacterium]